MKSNELCTYTSLDDLTSNCSNSKLIGLVSSVLRCRSSMEWELHSCSMIGDTCLAEFKSPVKGSDMVFYQYRKCDPSGEWGHISTSSVAPAFFQPSYVQANQ